MMKPTPRSSCRLLRGLTLIELMIGLALCAVLMSLAVPSYSAYLQRQRLKATALGLEQDLIEARYESARRGQPVYLAFVPGTDWCYSIAASSDCDCRVQQPCRIKTVRATDRRGVQLLESNAARFDPTLGSAEATGTTALWRVPGGEQVRVGLSQLGRPWVCAQQGAVPPLPGC